jgi:hypothetical protein
LHHLVASDSKFEYFGTGAFAVRLLRLDQKIGSGVPMSLKRVANVLGTDAMLFQEFCDRLRGRRQDADAVRGRAGGRGAGVLRPPGPNSPRLAPHGPFALSPRYGQSSGTDFPMPSRRRHRGASYGFSRLFRAHELRTQLRSAADQGGTTIVITSGELCKAIRNSGHSTEACCEAMQAEVKPGDDVLVSASGAGMTIRYRLPRTAQ